MITFLRNNFTNANPKNNLFFLAFIVLFSFGSLQHASAQVSAYVFSEAASPGYANLQSDIKTQLVTGTWNDLVVNTPIGFTFVFNGSPYTAMNVSSNGFVTFGATPPLATTYAPISTTTAYEGAIAGYSGILNNGLGVTGIAPDPLYPAFQANSVSKLLTGAPGSQILKVEWRNVRRGVTSAAETTLSFQIWLYETTNVIEVHYDFTTVNFATNIGAQVGLRGTGITDFNNRLYNVIANWPTLPAMTVAGTAANQNILIRSGRLIPSLSNRLFTWTPVSCSSPVAPVTISNLLSTTATATWGAPSPSPVQYDYEVRTSGAAGSGATGLAQSGFVTHPTVSQDFEQPAVPASSPYHAPTMPTCTTLQNAGTGNNWVVSNTNYYVNSNMDENMLMYNGATPSSSNAANAWFYTEGMQLTAGTTYMLQYNYGGSSSASFITNKLKVGFGMSPTAASMVILDNHPSIKTSNFVNYVNFTPTTSGVYFFGFNAYSDANNGQLYVDDVYVVPSSCLRPTGLNVPVALVTSSSALASWTAPSPAPSEGYAYYLSTSATAPPNTTPATGTVSAGTTILNLSSLASNTTYYLWVRSSCGTDIYGEWSTVASFTTLVAPVVTCVPSGATFTQDVNGIINVTMGSINNTTGIEANNYGDYSGLSTNAPQGSTVNVAITYGTGFTYDTAIWVDWNNDGDFNDASEAVYTGVSAAPNPSILLASFVVPNSPTSNLGPIRMRIGGIDAPTFAGGPLTPCRAGEFQAFEDYIINVVVLPPALTLSASTSTQCAGTVTSTVTITSTISDFDVYSWSPASGVTGTPATGYTFSNLSTQTYILTATQSSGSFSSNTVSYQYNSNDVPTPIVITTPLGATVCQSGPAIPIVASGGVVSNITIFNETFNSGLGAFTQTNASTGGVDPTVAPVWTVRPSGYITPGFFGTTITSNDATQFAMSNSDAQGGTPSPSITRTRLTSSAINLTGYSAAAIGFFQYLNWIAPTDISQVQISTDGGTNWTTLIQNTADVGTASNFTYSTASLNAYVGQTVIIRFDYQSNYGWWWAIDNFKVFGSTNSNIVWSPTTGLYNDAAASSPYLGIGANTVYALPSASASYTATVSTPMPTVCTANASTSITVTPIVAGTAAGAQLLCYGMPTDLTLTGNSHPVVKWQYASDALFTVGVTDIAASNLATLTSALMGTITATRYYRAVVNNGTCVANSNVIAVTYDSTTWNGTVWTNGMPSLTKAAIFTGNFTTSANLSTCSVKVLSGIVTFNGNRTLTVQNTVEVVGGSLIISNNTSLLQINDFANTGNITANRNTTAMIRGDYTYWSSPVTPQTLVALSPLTPSNKYFTFNPTTNAWVNIGSNNLMDAGKGYIIRAPSTFSSTAAAIFNGAFFGTPNNGIITTPIVGGANQKNLIGNPYPSALNADLFLASALNTSVIDATIYLWTHNTPMANNVYTANDYATYNFMGGLATATAAVALGVNNTPPTGKIASGQGFFIKGLSNGVATFTNAMRVAANNANFYRTTEEGTQENELERHRYWLDITNTQGAYKQILVGYMQNATNGIDRGFDSEVFEVGNVITMYSTLANKKLSIQGRTLPFDVEDTVPLGYKSTIAGTYTIALTAFDGLFAEGQEVYLEDTVLNVIHDLKAAAYTFATEAGAFDTRFILRYTSDSTLQVGAPSFDVNAVVVYKNLEGLHINSGMVNMASVQLHDIQGRLLATRNNIGATTTHFTTLSPTQQVVLVTITSQEGVIVTKKVVY